MKTTPHAEPPDSLQTRAALWRNLTATYPHWLTSGADFTPDGIKALFEVATSQAFAAGVRRGIHHAREIERRAEPIKVRIRTNTVRKHHTGIIEVEGRWRDGKIIV